MRLLTKKAITKAQSVSSSELDMALASLKGLEIYKDRVGNLPHELDDKVAEHKKKLADLEKKEEDAHARLIQTRERVQKDIEKAEYKATLKKNTLSQEIVKLEEKRREAMKPVNALKREAEKELQRLSEKDAQLNNRERVLLESEADLDRVLAVGRAQIDLAHTTLKEAYDNRNGKLTRKENELDRKEQQLNAREEKIVSRETQLKAKEQKIRTLMQKKEEKIRLLARKTL